MKIKTNVLATAVIIMGGSSAGIHAETNSGPYEPASVPHEGVRYLLSRNRIDVTVTKKGSKPILVKEFTDRNDPTRNALRVVPGTPSGEATFDLAANVNVIWESDPTKVFVLDLSPRAMSDAEVTIESHADGRLSAVNSKSTGKAGSVLSNIFKVIGSLAGFGTGGAFALVPDAAALANLPDKTNCDVWSRPLSEMDKVTRITIQHSQTACDAWTDVQRYTARAKTLRQQREGFEDQLLTAAASQVATVKVRIDAAIVARGHTLRDRSASIAIIEAEKMAFVAKWKIGPNAQPEKTEVFTLLVNELPVEGSASIRDGLTKVETANLLTNYSVAKRLFEATEHLVTVDSVPAGYEATQIQVRSTRDSCDIQLWHGSPSSDKDEKKRNPIYDRCKSQLIFYKRPISTTVKLWKLEEGAAGVKELKFKEQRQVMMIRTESPLEVLELAASAWSDGSLELKFDQTGVPSKVTWKSTSRAAAITGALATALADARTEYSATITELVKIKENKAKLDPDEKSALQKEIDELKKKKELVDARLEFEGAEASYESQLEQQSLAQQLALLNSEQAVVAAEQAAINQLDILRLAAEVARLQSELSIMKAQVDLDNLRNPD